MAELVRRALAAVWPLVEWLLSRGVDVLEWLLAEHEDWFDALVTPQIERAAARGWL